MLSLKHLQTKLLPRFLSKCQNPGFNRISSVVRLSTASDNGDKETKKSQLSFNVKRFGDLSVKDVGSCDFVVAPINPQLHPDQNLAFVDLPEGVGLKVDCKESNYLKVRREGQLFNVPECYLSTCNIEVPIKYNVSASLEGWSSVTMKDLQNDQVTIISEIGNCSISNLQSKSIYISSAGGKITSEGLLHGNAFLKTRKNGDVTINKILSQYLDVKTDRGAVDVKSLYSVHSKFSTNVGSVRIGNAHRSIEVKIKNDGNLIIDSLDGNLSASVNSGCVEVFISRTDGIDVHVQSGDVTLKLSTDLNARLDLEGSSVDIDDQIQLSNENRSSANGLVSVSGDVVHESGEKPAVIRAHTKEGSVILRLQSWIDSVKLANKSEE